MRLSDIARWVDGKLCGSDVTVSGVSIDSRTILPGELFIAISGPNFDGHDFLAEVKAKGAKAVLGSKPTDLLPSILVDSTQQAFGQMAHCWRQQFNLPIVAVTGSCGKTTIKSLLANILKLQGNVHANQGTLNNEFGVPLTLLGLRPEHDFAVIEMGANHLQEIAYLSQLAQPNIATISMVAPVHLEGFGNLQGVAQGKGEIFQGLVGDGIAVLNRDDEFFHFWQEQVIGKILISFGKHPEAQVRAENIGLDVDGYPQFELVIDDESCKVHLPLLGKHNVNNGLAAAACCYGLGVPLSVIKQGLETIAPVQKRMNRYRCLDNICIFDDSYNANPTSVNAALDVLASTQGIKVLVVGEMGELGAEGKLFHAQLGKQAKAKGIDRVYAVGNLTQHTVDSFGKGGSHFAAHGPLIDQLLQDIEPNSKILVKGSRYMQMEQVVAALKQAYAEAAKQN